MPPLATLSAPAKINLSLRILRRRDDGYHDLDSLFLPVPGLCDTLVVRSGPAGAGCQVEPALTGVPLEKNLVHRAWAAYARATGFAPDIVVELTKRIPTGAGLGGGSSDAAAMLLWLQAQAGQKALNETALLVLAAGLGADVPFFLVGGPALARGIGERLTPVELDLSGLTLVLVCPEIHIATPWAFGQWDSLCLDAVRIPCQEFLTSLETTHKRRISLLPVVIQNDFESVVFQAHPVLRRIKEQLIQQGAACAAMSGSGASVFALFRDELAANNAAQTLQRSNGLPVHSAALKHWGVAKR